VPRKVKIRKIKSVNSGIFKPPLNNKVFSQIFFFNTIFGGLNQTSAKKPPLSRGFFVVVPDSLFYLIDTTYYNTEKQKNVAPNF
jgi:hypothetical protein